MQDHRFVIVYRENDAEYYVGGLASLPGHHRPWSHILDMFHKKGQKVWLRPPGQLLFETEHTMILEKKRYTTFHIEGVSSDMNKCLTPQTYSVLELNMFLVPTK